MLYMVMLRYLWDDQVDFINCGQKCFIEFRRRDRSGNRIQVLFIEVGGIRYDYLGIEGCRVLSVVFFGLLIFRELG